MEKCGNGVIRRMQTVLQARLSLCRSLALSSPAGREYKSHFRGPGGGNIEPEQPWSEFVSSGKRRRAAVIKTGECDMIDSEDAVSKLPGANICAARSHSQKGQALQGCLHLAATRVCTACKCEGITCWPAQIRLAYRALFLGLRVARRRTPLHLLARTGEGRSGQRLPVFPSPLITHTLGLESKPPLGARQGSLRNHQRGSPSRQC